MGVLAVCRPIQDFEVPPLTRELVCIFPAQCVRIFCGVVPEPDATPGSTEARKYEKFSDFSS
jgi:hypothetical protein